MKYKIKVLQDTPFHRKDAVVSLTEFKTWYPIFGKDVFDTDIVKYVKHEFGFDLSIDFEKWFEVIEIGERFKVGDWVWHEDLKVAYQVVIDNTHSGTRDWKPNYATLDAVNKWHLTFKRLATKEEIDYHTLHSFCDGSVLIGAFKCYYFNNVWKELIGIHSNVSTYLNGSKQFNKVSVLVQETSEIEFSYNCNLGGLVVGCKTISHAEVVTIAKILNLI
jgi:hypothetical protein